MSLRRVVVACGLSPMLVALVTGIALAQTPGPTSSPRPAFALPPLDELHATRERPLFAPDRRPEAAAPAPDSEPEPDAPVEEATELSFELTGVVIGPEVAFAVLRDKTTKESQRLRPGETIGHWKIEDILPRQVVLRRGNKRVRLQLFEEEKTGESTADAREVVAGSDGSEPSSPVVEPEAENAPAEPPPQPQPRRRMRAIPPPGGH